MRFDAVGMFWEDAAPTRGRGGARGPKVLGPMPEIPYTGWLPPTEFPNLSAAKIIGFDTETKDPELLTAGPGWGRGSGHIVGVSIAVPGKAWYFPIRHEAQPEMNMEVQPVMRYLQHVLGDERPKVGANLIYDVGWLHTEGVTVRGKLYDVQYAEALLDSETPNVALEDLAQKHLGIGKTTDILYDWLARWHGGASGPRQRKHIYSAPVSLAGPYAESDAALPIDILAAQWPLMHARGVLDLFDLECRLIPLLVKMRLKGAPVDIAKAESLYEGMAAPLLELEKRMRDMAGVEVRPSAPASIKNALKKMGVPLPTVLDKATGKMKETTRAAALEEMDHPIAKLIVEHRQITKVRNVFIKGYVLDKHVNGRIHCSFNQLKSDESGARSGRFSSSDPNLQNIPVRTEIGKLVRDLFCATNGGRWRKFDYSQIEYRLLAHHAVGQGADGLRLIFNTDPDADYHEVTIALVKQITGIDLDRRPAKTINFGLLYGMSQAELALRLALSRTEAADLFKHYHTAAPFVRATMKDAEDEVHKYGTIRTILGRRSDFPLWGPTEYVPGSPGLPYQEAIAEWGIGKVKRAFTHKALNRRLQGGAADVMKKAMVDAYEFGLFNDDACGIPLLTVHDELDFDDQGDPEAPYWKELTRVLENCVKLRVPLRVDQSVGGTWGTAD